MWTQRCLHFSGIAIFCAALAAGNSPCASAGGNGKDGTTSAKPDREKKVYTNDDLEAWRQGAAPRTVLAAPAAATLEISSVRTIVPAVPYDPERDPVWYARQEVALEDQVAHLDAQIAQLRNYRATGSGMTLGLSIYAPCVGVGTDNLIAELVEQRQAITAQISDLEDTARRNVIPPGTFVDAPTLVAAEAGRVKLTPAGERARLTARLDRLSEDLSQVTGVVRDMEQDTASRGMTLLRYTGEGGNMTTNLLQDLGSQANGLRAQINVVSDEAHRAGVPASALP
jgi:hypothetical protein